MAKRTFDIEIREAIHRFSDQIKSGEAPAEAFRFYQQMSAHDCGLLCYGVFLGLSRDKVWIGSELHKFFLRCLNEE